MTQERFDYLSNSRRELVQFLTAGRDSDFFGIVARTHLYVPGQGFEVVDMAICQKEICEKLLDYAQTLLDEINKEIEEL